MQRPQFATNKQLSASSVARRRSLGRVRLIRPNWSQHKSHSTCNSRPRVVESPTLLEKKIHRCGTAADGTSGGIKIAQRDSQIQWLFAVITRSTKILNMGVCIALRETSEVWVRQSSVGVGRIPNQPRKKIRDYLRNRCKFEDKVLFTCRLFAV